MKKLEEKLFKVTKVLLSRNFKISPFRKVVEKLFALGKKYKDEKIDLMQGSVKLIRNSLHGVQTRRDITESSKCISETWMQTEFDETV